MAIISERIEGIKITVDIESSNLNNAVYETTDKKLIVTFNNGSIYEYYDVPWELFIHFRSALSQGKFFNTEIKEKFKYKKIK